MEWTDIVKIVFGALLGVLISFSITWIQRYARRKEIEKLLAIELDKLKWEMDVWSKIKNKAIPTSELPVLQFLGASELVALSSRAGTLAYSLQYELRKAESSRKLAAENLGNQESQIFKTHSFVYEQYLDSVQKIVDALRKELKMPTNPLA